MGLQKGEAFQDPGEPCRRISPETERRGRYPAGHLPTHLRGSTCAFLVAWICTADHLLPASMMASCRPCSGLSEYGFEEGSCERSGGNCMLEVAKLQLEPWAGQGDVCAQP